VPIGHYELVNSEKNCATQKNASASGKKGNRFKRKERIKVRSYQEFMERPWKNRKNQISVKHKMLILDHEKKTRPLATKDIKGKRSGDVGGEKG